jgi:quinol monooxygenase YgiN
MVYINVRHTVADYDKWIASFDENANVALRKSGGGTGKNQIFRDIVDTNIVTVILEWDSEEHANKFLATPELKAAMESAGVVGAPIVSALQSRVQRVKA